MTTSAQQERSSDRHAQETLALANALHRAGRLDEAEALYRSLAEARPDDPKIWAGLGELLLERKRYPEAIACLEVPASGEGASAEALNNLGYAHFLNGTYEFGLGILLKAIEKDPGDWRILMNAGETYLKMDNHRLAGSLFERAYRLNPDAPGLRLKLAVVTNDLGDFDTARRLFEQCLDDPSTRAAALGGLVRLGRQSPKDNRLAQIEAALQETSQPGNLRTLHYAAAKSYLDLEDSDAAFAHLKAAKSAIASTFSRDHFAGLVEQAKSIADLVGSEGARSGNTASPVFIVGMPRCGSSLTEQILSCHRQLFGAGERRYIANIAEKLGFGSPDPGSYAAAIKELPPDALPAIADGYLSLISTVGPGRLRTVDKFLHNFLHIGLILVLFPQARIVHCKRKALDCCLSIYTSPFGDGHHYANDLADLGWYYRQYEALMGFWSDRFAASILTVNYEDTVADLEASARRILAFLGLEWDPAVLRFTENKRGVSTASKWQVRQPLYRSSIDRWKPYETHLQPLIRALEDKDRAQA